MSDINTQRQIRELQAQIGRSKTMEDGLTGTAFPSGPTTGLRFFRTDLGFECYYDGTRWLTENEYPAYVGFFDAATITYAATTTGIRLAIFRGDYAPYFTYGAAIPALGATNNGTNYWTFNFVTNGATTIWTFNTSADAAGGNPVKTTTSFTQPGTTISFVQLNISTTGAPSSIVPRFPTLYYRLVVT